ncbi:transposase, partial [Salimicrobium jeotgali]
MFQSKTERQNEIEMVTIEELVPEDHLLRKIDQYIDFSFIPEKVRPYYSEDNGRPSLDPLVLFKMMFIGYIYGVRSERELERQI